MSDDKLAKSGGGEVAKRTVNGFTESVFVTDRWQIIVRENDTGDGSVMEIVGRRGEFILTDLGSGTASHPCVKLQIALRSRR